MKFLGRGRARWIRFRIGILVLALVAGAAAVAHGAWDLGVRRQTELRDLAQAQYKRRITLPARRGMITDRHGEELAVEVEVDSVYANPREVEAANQAAQLLAPILGVQQDKLERRMSTKRSFVWLRRRVTPSTAARVTELGLTGIHLIKESKRFYPNRDLASHLIGFAGIDAVGLEGIELKFDEYLQGRKSSIEGQRDARGRVVFADNVFGPKGVVGSTIELTIDRTLQHIAEHELESTVRTFDAKSGSVLVMRPSTGEVLAMANWPTFNPNMIKKSTPENRRDRAVLDVFEPGSTYKVFTLSAALNSGVVKPDEKIFCERGQMKMGDSVKVAIHDDHRDGWLTPNQCLKRSSNICFAKIALRLGKRRFYHYMRRFGFGERTDIALPFESAGVLRHFDESRDVDAAMAAFGQGVGVTSIQLAAGVSTIANGGTLMRPMLVRRIVGPTGETIRSFSPEKRRRVISRYTARLVGDMMTSVTEDGGTGTEGALDGFLVAGKTGTAQKADGAHGYNEDKWIASFVGFVPADHPKLVITVVIDEPLINHYGGTVAAPALRRIADRSLRYLGISPRHTKRAHARKRAIQEASSPQSTDSATTPQGTSPLPLALEPDQTVTPDLKGTTMTEALRKLSELGLRPVFHGTGFVSEQIPRPGSPIAIGEYVRAFFLPEERHEPDPGVIDEMSTAKERSDDNRS